MDNNVMSSNVLFCGFNSEGREVLIVLFVAADIVLVDMYPFDVAVGY
jgi:hypothetical protein